MLKLTSSHSSTHIHVIDSSVEERREENNSCDGLYIGGYSLELELQVLPISCISLNIFIYALEKRVQADAYSSF